MSSKDPVLIPHRIAEQIDVMYSLFVRIRPDVNTFLRYMKRPLKQPFDRQIYEDMADLQRLIAYCRHTTLNEAYKSLNRIHAHVMNLITNLAEIYHISKAGCVSVSPVVQKAPGVPVQTPKQKDNEGHFVDYPKLHSEIQMTFRAIATSALNIELACANKMFKSNPSKHIEELRVILSSAFAYCKTYDLVYLKGYSPVIEQIMQDVQRVINELTNESDPTEPFNPRELFTGFGVTELNEALEKIPSSVFAMYATNYDLKLALKKVEYWEKHPIEEFNNKRSIWTSVFPNKRKLKMATPIT